MAAHALHGTAEEILRRLEDMRTSSRSMGEHTRLLTCRACYETSPDCPCGRRDWVPIDVAIIELTQWLRTEHHKRRDVVTESRTVTEVTVHRG